MGIISERVQQESDRTVLSITPPFPKTMMIEPSNACNLRCLFCPNHLSPRKRILISLDVVDKVLTEGRIAGVTDVGFYLTGESFIHPKLTKMIAMAKNYGYSYIYMTTNGILADKKRVEELAKAGLNSIKFSINAGSTDSYTRIHGRPQYARVLQNLQDCLDLRNTSIEEGGCFYRVMVSSVWTPETKDELTALKNRFVKDLDDFIMVKVENRISEQIEKAKSSCMLPFNRIHVTAEGSLSFCCIDFNNDLIYANINSCSLEDAWNNSLAQSFRKKFLKEELKGTLCGKCLYGYQDSISPLS